MNRYDLYKAIGEADDELLERSERKKRRKVHKKLWWAAAAVGGLVLAAAVGIILKNGNPVDQVYAGAIAEADYPEMAPYPDMTETDINSEEYRQAYDAWREDISAQKMQPEGYADGLDAFFSMSIPQFLSGKEGENTACSPLNIYLELSMLAELTDGGSRKQILELVGEDSIEALRTQAKAVWNAHYRNDKLTTCILANSLWMNEDISYNPSVLQRLAEDYYASSYQGIMGSSQLNKMLQEWMNDQTGGLLKKQIEKITLDDDTILALVSTIYYQAQWGTKFNEENTQPDTFHAISGDITCDFMHGDSLETYYRAEKFEAVSWQMDNDGGVMWFLLPEKGVAIEDLLYDAETLDFLLNGGDPEKKKEVLLKLSVPKFDITSETDLGEGLQNLGVTDIFDGKKSDFSPLTEQMEGISVSQVKHDVRVTIDEKGVSAAAYTNISLDGAACEDPEEIEMNFNRPFLFAVSGNDGLPLFTGCVNEP